jgi:hypothetical protein
MIHLNPQLFAALKVGGRDAVQVALQQAIQLEHSTIPLYLYTLYSLDRGKNREIAHIIRSVVLEEMLHMTLACNILNALGRDPIIDHPDRVPTYPGPLPGGVESDLCVHLTPFSHEQLKTFMKIEEPEDPLKFPVRAALAGEEKPLTIGQFYDRIKKHIISLGNGAFSQTPRHQIGPGEMDEAVVVTNVSTAVQAIDTIVEQGEGTTESPQEALGGSDYAHYYRFAEIFHGRKLMPNPEAGPDTPSDQRYIYGGDPVGFEASGVYPAPTDPKAADYAAGSSARRALDKFNYTYTTLLKSLQALFTGQSGEWHRARYELMPSLAEQARSIMSSPDSPGSTAGPSFEYQPVDPG